MVPLTLNALTVLKTRGYLIKDRNKFESPEDMFRRAAHVIASADMNYIASDRKVHQTEERFFEMMSSLEFLSGGVLLNSARAKKVFSACFVLPMEDSLEGIFETMRNAALVSRMGFGLGISFSNLRSRGSLVASTRGVSSGPVSYLGLFNHMGQVINEGCARRVAMLAALKIDHPDIFEFITSKERSESLTNFNLSVAVTDAFMEALKNNGEYSLIDPHTKETIRTERAQEVWRLIAQYAWQTADPGLLFIDRINETNPISHLGQIETTNACGEQPLLPYESCNLGNINLGKVIKVAKGKPELDWEKLKGLIQDGVHFLDNLIDVCEYPLPEIDKMSKMTRKIGLGVMGWADLLSGLGIAYDTEEAIKLAEKVAQFIQREARAASVELGKKRGSFPGFAGSQWEKDYPAMRNSTVNTVAPTGTVSILANCSSGIEPIFALSYIRKNLLDLDRTELIETNPAFEKVAKEKGFYSEKLVEKLSRLGAVQEINEVPDEIKRIFVTAHDVSWEWHVKMQAAWQKYVDSGVSKTINLPFEASPEDVAEAYLMAYETGCKGITVYRDRSKEKQVLNVGEHQEKGQPMPDQPEAECCPECGGPLEMKDGCLLCPGCSFSLCYL